MSYPNGKEQKQAFERLCDCITPSLAFYCLCAVYNVPFEADIEADTWSSYLTELEQRGHPKEFADGETDANAAITAGLDDITAGKKKFGSGDDDAPYTDSDYVRLMELYRINRTQLDMVGGVIDGQQEYAAIFAATLLLQCEKLVAKGGDKDITSAKNLQEMARKTLEDSNMRKKDILPTQKQRPDGFVDALKRTTGLGPDMTQEDVLEVFYKWCKKKKYSMTTDAADQMLLSIQKTMAKNDDVAEPVDLPVDMQSGNFASEFAEEANEQEQEAYEYLGLTRGRFARGGED